VEHEHLSRLCFIDYQRQLALVAVHEHAGERSIIAVANLLLDRVADEAEFAITISDHSQRHGLGTELLTRLVDIGRAEKIGKIVGHILHENEGMLQVSRRCGFKFKRQMGDFFTTATFTLT
jgi:acetyltransferase